MDPASKLLSWLQDPTECCLDRNIAKIYIRRDFIAVPPLRNVVANPSFWRYFVANIQLRRTSIADTHTRRNVIADTHIRRNVVADTHIWRDIIAGTHTGRDFIAGTCANMSTHTRVDTHKVYKTLTYRRRHPTLVGLLAPHIHYRQHC